MASYFIDGVGDEVTIVFGIFMGIFIIVVAWLSTRVNDTRILEANDNINAVASELNRWGKYDFIWTTWGFNFMLLCFRNNVANQPNGNLSQQTNLSQENSVNSTAAPANALGKHGNVWIKPMVAWSGGNSESSLLLVNISG